MACRVCAAGAEVAGTPGVACAPAPLTIELIPLPRRAATPQADRAMTARRQVVTSVHRVIRRRRVTGLRLCSRRWAISSNQYCDKEKQGPPDSASLSFQDPNAGRPTIPRRYFRCPPPRMNYLARSRPVSSAIFRVADSRRRSRRVSSPGSWIVIVPFGPVTLILPPPARTAVPPALWII